MPGLCTTPHKQGCCALLGCHAYRMLIGACDPMLRPIHVFQASSLYTSDLGYGSWVGFSGGGCPNFPNGSSVCEPSHNSSQHGSISGSPGYVWPVQCAAVTDRLNAYIKAHATTNTGGASPAVSWTGCGGAAGPAEFCRGSGAEPPWYLGVQVVVR